MPKGKIPYTYKNGDTPLTVANQFGVTPQQLIDANPGGWPMNTGQVLNIPAGINSRFFPQVNPQPAALGSGAPMTINNGSSAAPGMFARYTPARGSYSYDPTPQWIQQAKAAQNAATQGQLAATPATPFSNVNPNTQQGAYVGQGVYLPNNIPTYSQSQGHPDPGLIHRILNNPAEYDALTPDQQKAIDNIATGASPNPGTVTNAAGTGSNEFMNTGFMQDNAARGTSFENQTRWDPDSKKYVKIGKLIAQGRLDVRDPSARLRRRRAGGGGGARQENGRLTGIGLVNFSVGSG